MINTSGLVDIPRDSPVTLSEQLQIDLYGFMVNEYRAALRRFDARVGCG
jgi:hypothetical protein